MRKGGGAPHKGVTPIIFLILSFVSSETSFQHLRITKSNDENIYLCQQTRAITTIILTAHSENKQNSSSFSQNMKVTSLIFASMMIGTASAGIPYPEVTVRIIWTLILMLHFEQVLHSRTIILNVRVRSCVADRFECW